LLNTRPMLSVTEERLISKDSSPLTASAFARLAYVSYVTDGAYRTAAFKEYGDRRSAQDGQIRRSSV
jgi:hypothetical protein